MEWWVWIPTLLCVVTLVVSVMALVWSIQAIDNTPTVVIPSVSPAAPILVQSGSKIIPYGSGFPTVPTSITFAQAFQQAPLVNTQTQSLLSGQHCTDVVTSVTESQFELQVEACPPVGFLAASSTVTHTQHIVRQATLSDGTVVPAILYTKGDNLYYQLAKTTSGSDWYTPAAIAFLTSTGAWDLCIRSDGIPIVAVTASSGNVVTYMIGPNIEWSGVSNNSQWDFFASTDANLVTSCVSLLETASGNVVVFAAGDNFRLYCCTDLGAQATTLVMNLENTGGAVEAISAARMPDGGLPSVSVVVNSIGVYFAQATQANATLWGSRVDVFTGFVFRPGYLKYIHQGSARVWVTSAVVSGSGFQNPVLLVSTTEGGSAWGSAIPVRSTTTAVTVYSLLTQDAQLAVPYLWNSQLYYAQTTSDNITAEALNAANGVAWDPGQPLTTVLGAAVVNQGPAVLIQRASNSSLYYFQPRNEHDLAVTTDFNATYTALGPG